MNPHWIGPYVVIKKYGPVNWGIKDIVSGKTKVVHHDLLKPAKINCDTTIFPSHQKQDNNFGSDKGKNGIYTHVILPRQPKLPVQSNLSDTMNHHSFSENVFQDSRSVPATSQGSTNIQELVRTRSGRVSRPVVGSRLIDDM